MLPPPPLGGQPGGDSWPPSQHSSTPSPRRLPPPGLQAGPFPAPVNTSHRHNRAPGRRRARKGHRTLDLRPAPPATQRSPSENPAPGAPRCRGRCKGRSPDFCRRVLVLKQGQDPHRGASKALLALRPPTGPSGVLQWPRGPEAAPSPTFPASPTWTICLERPPNSPPPGCPPPSIVSRGAACPGGWAEPAWPWPSLPPARWPQTHTLGAEHTPDAAGGSLRPTVGSWGAFSPTLGPLNPPALPGSGS